MSLRTAFLSFSLAVSIVALGGCTRGESKSVSDIFASARSDYMDHGLKDVPSNQAANVQKLTETLDRLGGVGGVAGRSQENATEAARLLNVLIVHSNPTVRPAMSELIDQFIQVSSANAAVENGAPVLRLLASRTYRLLSAELTSTRFRI